MTSSMPILVGGKLSPGGISLTRASQTPFIPSSWMNAASHPRSSQRPRGTVRRSSM